MKKIITILVGIVLIASCKKDEPTAPKPEKVYWGNAIYNPADVTMDYSTYLSYPQVTGSDVIGLQPGSTDGQPSKSDQEMIIGDTCYFIKIQKKQGACYLNNITSPVKGVFTSARTIKLQPCTWGDLIMVRGSVTLNDDNSIDVEYTDSLRYDINVVNHYKIHYEKNNQ